MKKNYSNNDNNYHKSKSLNKFSILNDKHIDLNFNLIIIFINEMINILIYFRAIVLLDDFHKEE